MGLEHPNAYMLVYCAPQRPGDQSRDRRGGAEVLACRLRRGGGRDRGRSAACACSDAKIAGAQTLWAACHGVVALLIMLAQRRPGARRRNGFADPRESAPRHGDQPGRSGDGLDGRLDHTRALGVQRASRRRRAGCRDASSRNAESDRQSRTSDSRCVRGVRAHRGRRLLAAPRIVSPSISAPISMCWPWRCWSEIVGLSKRARNADSYLRDGSRAACRSAARRSSRSCMLPRHDRGDLLGRRRSASAGGAGPPGDDRGPDRRGDRLRRGSGPTCARSPPP